MLGLVLLIVNYKYGPKKYDGFELITFTILMMSLTASLLAIFVRIRHDNVSHYIGDRVDDKKVLLEYQVVKTWRDIEGIAADIYSDEKWRPYHSIIEKFLEDSYINRVEAEELKDFLKMRNNIIHDTNNNYDTKTMLNTLKEVEKIVDNLKKATT